VFQWIVFNTLVGNSDCHLKNVSFMVDAQGIRLAPLYDLLCTAVYHTRTRWRWRRRRHSQQPQGLAALVGCNSIENGRYVANRSHSIVL